MCQHSIVLRHTQACVKMIVLHVPSFSLLVLAQYSCCCCSCLLRVSFSDRAIESSSLLAKLCVYVCVGGVGGGGGGGIYMYVCECM